MLPPNMRAGDQVRLRRPHHVSEERDADDVVYYIANVTEARPPFTDEQLVLNGAGAGIYLGQTRLKVRDHRAGRGFLRRLVHHFFFNGLTVIIDPREVDVIAKFTETSEPDLG